jgi:hypothetical protein
VAPAHASSFELDKESGELKSGSFPWKLPQPTGFQGEKRWQQKKKSRHHAPPPVADINVTPMVDVMLVLLIIFMVITPMLNKGIPWTW